LLAIPSASRYRRNEMIQQMRRAHVEVRTLPSVSELAQGTVSTSDLRELDIDDLLGREPVNPNLLLLGKAIHGKVVLVTGAGGSMGSELCRQILAVGPVELVLVEQSEFALYEIHQELLGRVGEAPVILHPVLASVRDRHLMQDIMGRYRPDTVYHAAAYKHVPLVEHNPVEGIRNNTLGTLVAAAAAAAAGVADFVLISTDKDRKSTRLNSSHVKISYAVFCLKQKIISEAGAQTHLQHILDKLAVRAPAAAEGHRRGLVR